MYHRGQSSVYSMQQSIQFKSSFIVYFIEVAIVAKNDYCDSIDIAGSAIAILLLLWTTIAILL